MTVNKGLKTLVENTPNFSNQALENAINDIKTKVNSDWVTRTFDVDQAIEDNTVLTGSQKNDLKDTINNYPYLNIGRYLNDTIRHTNTILDGSIVTVASGEDSATFLETLQSVQAIQNLIPQLYGVPASEKSRDVNDHFGTLNNKFLQTEDSSKPVFESITEQFQAMMRHNVSSLNDDGGLETALDNLKNFIDSVVSDSTDFQQTLDTFATAVASNFQTTNTFLLNAGIFGSHTDIQNIRIQLLADRDEVVTQVNLENANLSGIRTYVTGLANHTQYSSLAEDSDLRKLMSNISQNTSWKSYFETYETNFANLNPVYDNITTDSDKATVINQVLKDRGLPDVVDHLDIDSVVKKAKKDTRIDTKNFDYYTTEQIITKCCEQLGISTANKSVYNQSKLLLNNLNENDKELISEELDRNEDANTLS
jgi:hypothetical protein